MAVYAAAYLICGNVRIGVCLGMAISMIHGMIDHYVMLFRGTPVMLSDIAAIGTAANVSKGYSAPMELSVLPAAAAVLFCVSVCLMQRSFKVHKRWYFRRLFFAAVRARAGVHRLHRHPDGRHRTGVLAVQPPVQRDFLLPCAARPARLSSSRRATTRTRFLPHRANLPANRARKRPI